ncbi:MAG TPA: hemolysin family protein [Smithellaceae bacterium]|nr:hemolysin family protein [Smithellaceae bacterium]
MSAYLIFAVVIGCLILEALYSGGEIALISSDINKIRFFARRGSFAAKQALKLMKQPEWFISTTIIGTNLSIVTSSTLATGFFLEVFGPVRGEQISFLIIFPTLLVMIIARSIFQQYAEKMAMKLAFFIRISSVIFYPAAYLIATASRWTVRFLTGQRVKNPSYITKEGLKFVLGEKTQGSDILKTEREMVSRVFDFSEITADKIMIPLSALTALPVTTKITDAARIVAGKKYLRIPVYQGQIFNIVGVLHYFDLLQALYEQKEGSGDAKAEKTIESCLQKQVLYVPETKKAGELLMDMQRKHEPMAVVVDEYGGALGIVTSSDIEEEIVGSIDDEYSTGEKLYKKIAPGKYLMNGRMGIDELEQILALELPVGNYETLGGFLMFKLGKVPQRKEKLEYSGINFIIENADQKSIREVMVVIPEGLVREIRKKPERQ